MARGEDPLTLQDLFNLAFDTTRDEIKTLDAAYDATLDALVVASKQENNLAVLATGAIAVATEHVALTGLGPYNNAIVQAIFATLTLPDGDDVIDLYLQTSYDGGTTWVDIENLHFETAANGSTPTHIFMIGPPVIGTTVARVPVDGAVADNTKIDIPLGDRLRFKSLLAGATAPTYNFTAVGKFW